MSFESQLIGQSTLLHDFRIVIYNRLQFFRIVFLWNKLLDFGWVGNIAGDCGASFGGHCFLHLKLFAFEAAGEEGESAMWD